jgi:hypothetical protein
MTEMAVRMDDQMEFWGLFEEYNELLHVYMEKENMKSIIDETILIIHSQLLNTITSKYLQEYE